MRAILLAVSLYLCSINGEFSAGQMRALKDWKTGAVQLMYRRDDVSHAAQKSEAAMRWQKKKVLRQDFTIEELPDEEEDCIESLSEAVVNLPSPLHAFLVADVTLSSLPLPWHLRIQPA